MRTRHDFWHVPVSPAELQRVQDAHNDHVGRTMREVADEQDRRHAKSDRDDVIAHMARMVANDRHAHPDFWAGYAVEDEVLATLNADYVLARRRR